MGRQTGLVLIDRSQAFSPSVALLCVALRGLALRGVDYHSTHRDSALAAGKCPGYR